MSENKISRRNFLISIFTVSGLSFFAGSYWYSYKVEEAFKRWDTHLHDQDVRKLFSKVEESMDLIGKEYVNNYTIDTEGITQSNLEELNNKLASQNITSETFFNLAERIKQQVISDFENEDYVEIGNWMITKTEANLCAIIHLSK